MENSQALEIAESIFADAIKRRLVGGDYEEQALKTIRAALATPVGWKLVPIEPTEEMLDAYKVEDGDHSDWDTWLEWDGGDATRLYKSMIAAAPPHTEERG